MDRFDGLAGSNKFRQGAPKEHLIREFRPAVKEREAKAEPRRPLCKLRSVERRLTIIDHHDSGFAHLHIDAFLAEYLHIGDSNWLVAHLEGLTRAHRQA